MSYHLRLVKALSYTGIVKASKQNPDVFTDDKSVADKVLESGYFSFIESDTEQTSGLDRSQLESMKLDDLKHLAADMEIDVSGLKTKSDYVEAIADQEIIPEELADYGEDN